MTFNGGDTKDDKSQDGSARGRRQSQAPQRRQTTTNWRSKPLGGTIVVTGLFQGPSPLEEDKFFIELFAMQVAKGFSCMGALVLRSHNCS